MPEQIKTKIIRNHVHTKWSKYSQPLTLDVYALNVAGIQCRTPSKVVCVNLYSMQSKKLQLQRFLCFNLQLIWRNVLFGGMKKVVIDNGSPLIWCHLSTLVFLSGKTSKNIFPKQKLVNPVKLIQRYSK